MSPYLRPLLVFLFMAALVAQVLTRFLDAMPGSETSGAVRGLNGLLDFVLISRIGVAPSAVALAVLTIVFTALAHRRHRPKLEPVQSAPPERVARVLQSAARTAQTDRRLVNSMVAGVVSDFARDQALSAAKGTEPVVARLAPQIPPRDLEHPHSWLGGSPAMSDDVPWPEIGGQNTNFLAQISCADLPADLWDGHGPRDGWLAFFIHPTNYVVRILHLHELGPWRQAPDTQSDWFSSWVRLRSPVAPIMAWPRWPVDLVSVRPGGTDPLKRGKSQIRHDIYRAGYDLTTPEHRPFDRSSMLDMFEVVQDRLAWAAGRDWMGSHLRQLEQAQTALAVAEEASGSAGEIAELEGRIAQLQGSIDTEKRAVAMFDAALTKVRALAERVRAGSPEVAEQDQIASVMQELSEITILGEDGKPISLTVHDGRRSLWVHQYEDVRFERARHAYAAAPDALPARSRAYFEGIWQDIAPYEMASTGHIPFGYVGDFDPGNEITLLELPSSDLLGWSFGDVDNLVVIISKRDLAAGRFDNLRTQITN